MKNFRVCNNDLSNWIEFRSINQIDVVRAIERRNMKTFEIEWKTPVTGEYATILKVKDGIKVFEADNFKIPRTFRKLYK